MAHWDFKSPVNLLTFGIMQKEIERKHTEIKSRKPRAIKPRVNVRTFCKQFNKSG